MKNVFIFLLPLFMLCVNIGCTSSEENGSSVHKDESLPKGTLFIIGGGDRDSLLMQHLITVSGYKVGDKIAVVTLASGWGDSAYIWLNDEFKALTKSTIDCIKIDSATVKNAATIDSLMQAKIIFLSGGDQSVLMKHIQGTDFKKKIQEAYWKGATIAGTSAGAALMSEKMITGNALLDTSYEATFDMLRENNVEIKEGLGLLDSVIIDQHFIARSRYNRVLSALHDYPAYRCIGIDEATALIVHNGKATVAGESQILSFSNTETASDTMGIINTKNIDVDIYTAGETLDGKW